MAVVHIPAPLRELTAGERTVAVAGHTVAELVERLEARFPGLRERLLEEGKLRAGLTVLVDGEERRTGLGATVGESSEVYFLHAMSGGASITRSWRAIGRQRSAPVLGPAATRRSPWGRSSRRSSSERPPAR